MRTWSALPKDKQGMTTRRTLRRTVQHVMGLQMEDDDFEKLWLKADQKQLGKLDFDDFQRILAKEG